MAIPPEQFNPEREKMISREYAKRALTPQAQEALEERLAKKGSKKTEEEAAGEMLERDILTSEMAKKYYEITKSAREKFEQGKSAAETEKARAEMRVRMESFIQDIIRDPDYLAFEKVLSDKTKTREDAQKAGVPVRDKIDQKIGEAMGWQVGADLVQRLKQIKTFMFDQTKQKPKAISPRLMPSQAGRMPGSRTPRPEQPLVKRPRLMPDQVRRITRTPRPEQPPAPPV